MDSWEAVLSRVTVTQVTAVTARVWHDLLSKFGVSEKDRVKVITNLERTLWDELETLFRSYWTHRLDVSDGLLQVLGLSVRVRTQEAQGYQLQGPEHHVEALVY